MASEIKIEGYENALRILAQYPDQFQKLVKSSMRTAVQSTLKVIKAGTPHSSFKRIVKAAFIKADYPTILFGYFGDKKKTNNGSVVSAFMKAYWSEFGTLENRDKNHVFKNKVKGFYRKELDFFPGKKVMMTTSVIDNRMTKAGKHRKSELFQVVKNRNGATVKIRKGGILPRHYYEKAIQGQEKIIYSDFVKALESEATKLINND